MRYIILLPLLLITGLPINIVHADPPRIPVSCTSGGLTEHPKFTQVSPGRAEYNFGGACITHDGRSFAYRASGTWTPSEHGYANADATEIYHVDTTSGPAISYVVVFGANCGIDPWLYQAGCRRVGDNMPDELRALWPELADSSFPHSRYGISDDQRVALRAEYARANSKWQRIQPSRVRLDTQSHIDAVGIQTRADAGAVDSAAEDASLNPQPLPPGPPDPDLLQSSSRATQAALNPQPLPPRPVDAVSLNPQPLPPGPADTPMMQAATSKVDAAGIIIVSGKNKRFQQIRSAPAATPATHP